MSRVRLLPRLNSLGVSSLLTGIKKPAATPATQSASAAIQQNAAFVSYAPSGGSVNEDLVSKIFERVREIAEGCGFPDSTDRSARAAFDTEVAKWLGAQPDLASGEALRDDAWAFMTLALLPDVVAWRFPDRNAARFEGGVRNALQRLWVRGITLDLGELHPSRWRLLEALSEDAMVQIFERASIASDVRLARAIAEAWISISDRIGRGNMEDVMRRAIKYLRIRNEIIDLAFLEDAELLREVKRAFFKVAMMAKDYDERRLSDESDRSAKGVDTMALTLKSSSTSSLDVNCPLSTSFNTAT